MCSDEGDRTLLLPGFPIRKSSDHSSVDSSPRLIAASYVLLRLLVPRHPPCALNNLATKMLASTVQFSRYGREQILVRRVPEDLSRSFDGRICPSSNRRRRSNVHRAPARRIRVKRVVSTRSLRTQQRAETGRPRRRPRSCPEAVLGDPARRPANWSMFHP